MRYVITAIATLVLLVGMTMPVRAEPCTRAIGVKTGKAVPCDGDLVPASELLRLLQIETDHGLAETALEKLRASAAADLALARAEIEAERQKAENEAALRRQCELAKSPPPYVPDDPAWYTSPWFGGAVGLVVGVTSTVLIVRALR